MIGFIFAAMVTVCAGSFVVLVTMTVAEFVSRRQGY